MSTVKENKSQGRAIGDALPPPYVPVQAGVSFLTRVGWRCTSFGRARLNLWLAQRAPDSEKLRTALERKLPQLLTELSDGKPERRFVLRDTLLFLAWSDLQAGTFEDVVLTLSVLDRRFPTSIERLTLRWDLMQRLLQSRSYLDYQKQAKLLLSDSISVGLGGAVLETLRVVYTDLPMQQRVGLADSVHASLIADPRVRASLSQWKCPTQFASRIEAHSWMEQISPEHLDFAPRMKADALITLGHVAEWDRDWAGMETRAYEALQIVPNDPEAVFLSTRSLLRQADRTLPEEVKTAAFPDEPKWQRLRLQRNLRERASLEHADALIARLPHAARDGDVL